MIIEAILKEVYGGDSKEQEKLNTLFQIT